MRAITIPNPSPGKHTIREPLDPQPELIDHGSYKAWLYKPPGSQPMFPDRNEARLWTPSASWVEGKLPQDTGAAGIVRWAPFAPGETYWVRERWGLGTGDGVKMGVNVQVETDPWCVEVPQEHREAAYAIWDKVHPNWQPASTMPQWASRFTARCLSVNLEHGEVWEWVIEFEVTNTRSE